MRALFLALTLCACAPIHHPQPLKLKGPMIAPLDHVNCRAVNNGKYRNSGCVA
jgi:hypothetical protein